MPIDVDIPLIDHHCHGLVPRNVTRHEFEKLISESFVDAPAGTSHFDAPFGLAIRAHCAPLLDLEPFADPDAYIERRAALGAAEVNRRFLKAGNHGLLLIQEDPHDIDADGRRSLGIVELPATLELALARLETDAVVKSWFSRNLWQTCIAVKRKEIELMANLGPDEICERYRNAY